jgi:hypothetical protein
VPQHSPGSGGQKLLPFQNPTSNRKRSSHSCAASQKISWRKTIRNAAAFPVTCPKGSTCRARRKDSVVMRLHLLRWLLDPVTSFTAFRQSIKTHGQTSFDVAWRRARVERFPDETLYQRHGHAPGSRETEREGSVRRPDKWPN